MKKVISKSMDELWQEFYGKITSNQKLAFFSTVFFGFIAHLYMFMNKLPNYDDIGLNGFGATFRLGRWFLWFVGAVAYHLELVYSIPWVNGLISVVLIAVAAMLFVDLFQVESKILVFLISGLLIVFPSWTATFFFMFTAPYYALAVVLSVFSVYVTMRYKKGIFAGMFFLILSLGIYQSYLPFVATMYVILLVFELLNKEADWKVVLKKAFIYLAALIGSVVVYYGITRVSLIVTHQSMADYKGLGNLGQFSVSQTIQNMLTNGLGVCMNNNLEISYNLLLKAGYGISIAVLAGCILYTMIYLVKEKQYVKAIFYFVLNLCFAIAINAIYIMCQEEGSVYVLMTYAYSFWIIYPLLHLAYIQKAGMFSKTTAFHCIENSLTAVCLCIVLNYCHFANAQYLAMDLSFQQAESYYTTLITQIKSLDGYTDDMPVVLIQNGKILDKTLYQNEVVRTFDITGRDRVFADTYNKEVFMQHYLGFSPVYIPQNEISQELIEDMPCYPQSGSIKIVDGMILIKLS